MGSQLKATKTRRKFLEVYYQGSILDAEHAIQRAIAERGLDRDKVTVLAYPMSMKQRSVESPEKAPQRVYRNGRETL